MKHLFLLFTLLCLLSCTHTKKEYALDVINRVEKFKKEQGRYPKNAAEIGLKESDNSQAYYLLLNDSNYEVWYRLGLGQSDVYYSWSKKWEKKG